MPPELLAANGVSSTNGHGPEPHPFADNFECIEALEEAFLSRVNSKEGGVSLGIFWERLKRSDEAGILIPLMGLCRNYDLNASEREIVALLLALATGGRFRKECRQIREMGRKPSVGMILDLLGHGPREKLALRGCFAADGKLVGEGIVEMGFGGSEEPSDVLDEDCRLSGRFLNFLLGDSNFYSLAGAQIRREAPHVSWDEVILPEKLKGEIGAFLDNLPATLRAFARLAEGGSPGLASPVILIDGQSGTGKTLLARAIAARLGRGLFLLDAGSDHKPRGREEAIRTVFREARLSGGVVFFDECHEWLDEDSDTVSVFLTEVERSGCLTILATNRARDLDRAMERRILYRISLPFPEAGERRRILEKLVSTAGIDLAPEVDLAGCAWLYAMTGGDLGKLVSLATVQAVRRDPSRERPLIGWEEIDAAADLVAEGTLNPFWRYGFSDHHRKEAVSLPEWAVPIRRLVESYLRLRDGKWLNPVLPRLWTKGPGLSILVRGESSEEVAKGLGLLAHSLCMGWACAYTDPLFAAARSSMGVNGHKIDDLFDSAALVHRLCVIFDSGDGLMAQELYQSPAGTATTGGMILGEIFRHRGISIVVSDAKEIHPSYEARFHLVTEAPRSGGKTPSKADILDSYLRDGWPADPTGIPSMAGLPIDRSRMSETAYRAWIEWAASGGEEGGKRIDASDMERVWNKITQMRKPTLLFGG